MLDEVAARLSQPDLAGRTEADIQADVRQLLLSHERLGLDLPKLEEQVGDGTRRRIDVRVGATVIEVKKSLERRDLVPDYVQQLAGYVRTKTEREQARYNGILSDGRRWQLYELDPHTDTFELRSSFELTGVDRVHGLASWLESVLATPTNVLPTQATIEQFLGSSSPAYAQDRAYLKSLYHDVQDDPTVHLKRELWARLLRSALGTGFEDSEDLFVDHTLLVIEAAAIGHAVMEIPLEDLVGDPESLFRGSAFADASIYNVVENDFFDWVLAAPDGGRFVSRLVRRVSVFDWSSTEHDVLKVLYESIINADTRKRLGEYYTPDWLAEGIVTKAVSEPLSQKVLDPACGSGTFIFHTVRLKIAAAEAAGWRNEDIVQHLQDHVFGLDIHPVSVLLARITYLLALGSHLLGNRGNVWVPIHLGDSMQWSQPTDYETSTVRISTDSVDLTASEGVTLFDVGAQLAFPLSSVGDPETFDRLITDMVTLAKSYTSTSSRYPRFAPVLRKFGIPEDEDASILGETFQHLCNLHAAGRDSIWGYFVRNQVRPLWLSMQDRRVDVLVGNPPWVAYRYMTATMQQQFQGLAKTRGQWHGRNVATHQDLVALFITRAVEKYLHDGGTFAFVAPLATLTRQQYEGFRAGKWGEHLRGHFTELWDLDQVRPRTDLFPVPAAVLYGARATQRWQQPEPDHGSPAEKLVVAGLRDRSGWAATEPNLTFTPAAIRSLTQDMSAASPYGEHSIQGATITPRMAFFVTVEQRQSRLGQAAGRLSVQSLRTAQEKKPWKDLPSLEGVVEGRYVRDVVLGSTIAPFRILDPWKAVLPIERGKLVRLSALEGSGAKSWLEDAAAIWEENKTKQSKLSLMDSLDFQGKLTRQLGGAGHRVVLTASGSKLSAARLESSETIIEHALYWLPVRSRDEARYLTLILNAEVTTERLAEYQSRGLFGARHFDNYVWQLPIPRFGSATPLHVAISELGAEAEAVAADVSLQSESFTIARKMIREQLAQRGISARMNDLVVELLGDEA